MWEEQHWTEKREFKILSPYKNTTKTELVKKYLELNNNPEALFISFSCYEPKCITPPILSMWQYFPIIKHIKDKFKYNELVHIQLYTLLQLLYITFIMIVMQ